MISTNWQGYQGKMIYSHQFQLLYQMKFKLFWDFYLSCDFDHFHYFPFTFFESIRHFFQFLSLFCIAFTQDVKVQFCLLLSYLTFLFQRLNKPKNLINTVVADMHCACFSLPVREMKHTDCTRYVQMQTLLSYNCTSNKHLHIYLLQGTIKEFVEHLFCGAEHCSRKRLPIKVDVLKNKPVNMYVYGYGKWAIH